LSALLSALSKAIVLSMLKLFSLGKDYNEFKAFVSCSHLQPLQSKDLASLIQPGANVRGIPYNHVARSTRDHRNSDVKAQPNFASSLAGQSAPSSISQMERDWKRKCSTISDKYNYLRNEISPVLFSSTSMFGRTTLDPTLMSDILHVLWCAYHKTSFLEKGESSENHTREGSAHKSTPLVGDETCNFVYLWMDALSKCGRFSLNLSFLAKDTLKEIADMILFMSNSINDSKLPNKKEFRENVNSLAIKYGMTCA